MEIYLTENHCRADLFPFTEIRHTADIRLGILTIKEKWERLTSFKVHLVSEAGITTKDSVFIQANIIPTLDNYQGIIDSAIHGTDSVQSDEIKLIKYPWHIAQFNEWAIRKDFSFLTNDRISESILNTNKTINQNNIFIEKGVKMDFCILNASEGPIYLGRNVQVMEGSMIKGPIAICDNSVVKMGSKLYGGTTIGPWCVAGGEIKNSVFFSNSNKAHDGYLGDSVIGEWCNLGAGTSNSNLKNTAGDVIFNINGEPVNAGSKAGLMMGDYSRSAINTSFNTGSIIGISCNIFGNITPPRVVKNFSWGDQKYEFDKAIRDIENWTKLKNKSLSEMDKKKLNEIYNK